MRILVTRPYEDAERTAGRLAALGCEAMIAPVLEIAAAPFALDKEQFDAVIVTSAQVFRLAGERFDDLARTPLWVVGERTSREAAAAGWTHIEMVAKDSSELACALSDCGNEGRWLYLAGAQRSAAIETAMKAQSKNLKVAVVYETRIVAGLAEAAVEAISAGRIDSVLHFSARSAAAFVVLARAQGFEEAARRLQHVAISQKTSQALACFPCVRVAASPDESAVLDALWK